jgi:hypothetical protein
MPTRIFVNLPVKSLDRSVAFFAHLGYGFDLEFTNENATCMVVGDNIFGAAGGIVLPDLPPSIADAHRPRSDPVHRRG